ncbi:MAG: hypothetical protein P4L36_03005 [Holophaga sp.]|nr:hypothetical protein [Holophaga sp.]
MKQKSTTIPNAILMTLLGSATLGGLALAFSARKTAKELRNGLKALASRFDPKTGQPDQGKDEIVQAAFI